MAPTHKYDLKKGKEEKKFPLQDHLPGEDMYKFFLSQKELENTKKLNKKNHVTKRISPFLIVAFCLPVLFTYMAIKNNYSMWYLFFLFLFIQINILVVD